MLKKLKYYVWILNYDVDVSIDKVIIEYSNDVADVCRIFDCTVNDVAEWLKKELCNCEES